MLGGPISFRQVPFVTKPRPARVVTSSLLEDRQPKARSDGRDGRPCDVGDRRRGATWLLWTLVVTRHTPTAEREAMRRGPCGGRLDRAEPLANPARACGKGMSCAGHY